MRRTALLVVVLAISACSHRRPTAPSPDLHSARLAAAAAQVRAGCLDCLIASFREYDALRALPAAAEEAAAGAVRAAALIALRQRELGMVDEGYLQRARRIVEGTSTVPAILLTILEVIDATPAASVGAGHPTSDLDLERMRLMRTNREAWTAALRESAGAEVAASYTWLVFMCGTSDARNMSRDELLAPTASFADLPLLQYRSATCRAFEEERLLALQAAEPRFREIDYARGLSFVGKRKLDDADAAFERAREWHPAWPTLTLAVANVAMTAEEFERALAMYDETLRYEPKAVDALLGKVRALTFLARNEEAIATVDQLLAERWYVGDGRYWRAVNELQLERFDEAWTDIELAAKLLINAEVPKLAGIIAYRRHELEVSRAKFDESRSRNPQDCETGYYLGLVLAELSQWPRASEIIPEAARCLQGAVEQSLAAIEQIRAGDDPPARKARKIASREQRIATARRWIATSWFNSAICYYNLSRPADARDYAERVVNDEQFGERARELLSRLR
jgi:tetratricopeptide (TPR) repeat protein